MAYSRKNQKTPTDVLTQVDTMLASPIFTSNKTNPQHAEFLQHTKEELRKIQSGLATASPSQQEQITKWLNQRSTTKRLANLGDAIHVLQTAEITPTKPSVISQCVRNVNNGTQYSSDFTKFFDLENLIKRREALQRKINNIQQAKAVVSSTADIAGSLNTVVKAGRAVGAASAITSDSAATLAHSSHALGAQLSPAVAAIPIIGGIVNAVVASGSAIYSFAKKKGASDNVAKAITAGVAIAAVVCTALFPVAALAIAAGTNAVTTATNYVKPYIDMGKEIEAKEKQLEVSKTRLPELEKPDVTLIEDEKAYLIDLLKDHHSKTDSISLDTLKQDVDAIRAGNLESLEKNPRLREALSLSDNQTVKDKLIEHHTDNNNNMADNIAQLKKDRTATGAMAVMSSLATAGLAMMAVPIPPVFLAGAIVAAVTTVAMVAIHFREPIKRFFNKIGDLVKKAFSREKTNDNELENKLTNKNDIEMSGGFRNEVQFPFFHMTC